MVSRSLVRFGLVGIELACIPVGGELVGSDEIGKSLGLHRSIIARNRFAVSFRFTPLEIIACGLSEGIEVGGNIPRLWSSERTWRIKAGTSDGTTVLSTDPFSVSINSVSKSIVVVAVLGTKGNDVSWGNHWSVSWVLVLLVAGL